MINNHAVRSILHPKRKKYVKQKINKKRRKLLKSGLNEIKLAYNQNYDINKIDYYNNAEYIKIMSRTGADYIERRTTNGRIILGDCW